MKLNADGSLFLNEHEYQVLARLMQREMEGMEHEAAVRKGFEAKAKKPVGKGRQTV